MRTAQMKNAILAGKLDEAFKKLYPAKPGELERQRKRYAEAVEEFERRYGEDRDVFLFSAPGRTEIGGNHTDHQHGRVLAAGIHLDIIAVAALRTDAVIRIKSKGHEEDTVQLSDLNPHKEEENHAAALIRGTAARFVQLGFSIGGFDAYTTSEVLKGSGLSSSAAFEVLVGTMLNHFFNGGAVSPVRIAQIAQYAENEYFKKPCGLMDQTACSVGGFVAIDFKDTEQPRVEKVDFDFAKTGFSLCIVNTGGSHSDLTGDYADVPAEMFTVARFFEKPVLREVDYGEFIKSIGQLRQVCSDRAILRAFHFFAEDERAALQAGALKKGDFAAFLKLVLESGSSSYQYLQNVFTCKNPQEQPVALGLCVAEHLLRGKGAWRVHGGGFAGTIQAYVPNAELEAFSQQMERVFGAGSCQELSVRNKGGICLTL